MDMPANRANRACQKLTRPHHVCVNTPLELSVLVINIRALITFV
jgi:hypothetical protein